MFKVHTYCLYRVTFRRFHVRRILFSLAVTVPLIACKPSRSVHNQKSFFEPTKLSAQTQLSVPRDRFDPVYMGQLFEEYEKYRNIYDWLEWGKDANDALQNGKPLPPNPISTWGTVEIIRRLDGLKRLVNSQTVPVKPNVISAADITLSLSSVLEVRHGIAAHNADLQNIQQRVALLSEIRSMMQAFKRLCAEGAKGFQDLIGHGGPDIGNVISGAWYDLSVTLPQHAVEAEREIETRQRDLEQALASRTSAYAEWEAQATGRLQALQAAEARRHARGDVESGRDAAREAGLGVRPGGAREPTRTLPESDQPIYDNASSRPTPNRDRPEVTVSSTVLGLVTATVPDVPVPIEFHFIPPEMYVLPPPEEPGFEVPDGASILFIPVFLGNDASIDVWAEETDGTEHPIQTWAGRCGADSALIWSNHLHSTVNVRVAGYRGQFEGLDPKSVSRLPRIARTDQAFYHEITALGWGFRPPGRGVSQVTAAPNDAVLLAIRTDGPDRAPPTIGGKATAQFDQRRSRTWKAGIIFPTHQTTVDFQGRSLEGGAMHYTLGKHSNGWGGLYTYQLSLTDESPPLVELTASTENGVPLGWQSMWLNPFFYLAGVGHTSGPFANSDTPYRAVFFAAAINMDACSS